jgi:hypothetical protein
VGIFYRELALAVLARSRGLIRLFLSFSSSSSSSAISQFPAQIGNIFFLLIGIFSFFYLEYFPF